MHVAFEYYFSHYSCSNFFLRVTSIARFIFLDNVFFSLLIKTTFAVGAIYRELKRIFFTTGNEATAKVYWRGTPFLLSFFCAIMVILPDDIQEKRSSPQTRPYSKSGRCMTHFKSCVSKVAHPRVHISSTLWKSDKKGERKQSEDALTHADLFLELWTVSIPVL